METYECLRNRPVHGRDIYNELRRIEERGMRLKAHRTGMLAAIFGKFRRSRGVGRPTDAR